MRRLSVVVAVSLLISFPAFSQTTPPGGAPAVRPPTGAQLPGMPSRDANRPTTPQAGTGKIIGRVLAAQTGQPLRRAQVSLVGTAAPNAVRKSTTTDADGRYEFSELPAGSFSITATKGGFVNLQFGQRRPFEQGTPVALADAQVVEKVDFMLPRGGVIVARVTDDFGEPLAGAQVQVQRYQYQPDGQRRLVSAPIGGFIGLAATDDRGELRIYGLMPGEYIVSASMRSLAVPGLTGNDAGEGFSPTFYAGVVSAEQATPVAVRVGEEANVQFAMTTAKLARIGGTVVDSEGRPAAGVQLTLITRSGTGFFSSGAGIVSPDGSFTIGGVAPGEHTLEVRPRAVTPGSGATAEGASTVVNVGGADVTNLRIVTSRGTHISGRVVYEGTSSRDGLPIAPRVMVTPADPSRQLIPMLTLTDPLANGTIDDKGNFQLTGASGRVFFNMTTPPGWVMKSVMLDGQNIIDEPMDLTGRSSISDLVITLTDKLPTVNGQVTGPRAEVLKDYVVVILPAQEMEPTLTARWTRTVRPNTEGRFEVRGLRPGRYVATAIESLEQGRQFAPDFQQQLRRAATAFSVDEGQTATLDLRLTPDL